MKLLPGSLSSEHLASSLWAVEHGAESEVPGIWYRGIGSFAWYGNRFAVYNIYTHTPWTCVPDLHCTGGAGGIVHGSPLLVFWSFDFFRDLENFEDPERISKILEGNSSHYPWISFKNWGIPRSGEIFSPPASPEPMDCFEILLISIGMYSDLLNFLVFIDFGRLE